MKLDPNRDPKKFERAAMALAMHRAKTEVKAQIQAKGLKLSEFSCREITAKAEAYFAANLQALIPQAVADAYRYWC